MTAIVRSRVDSGWYVLILGAVLALMITVMMGDDCDRSTAMHRLSGVEVCSLYVRQAAVIDSSLIVRGNVTITGDLSGSSGLSVDSLSIDGNTISGDDALILDILAGFTDSLTAEDSLLIGWKYGVPETLMDVR